MEQSEWEETSDDPPFGRPNPISFLVYIELLHGFMASRTPPVGQFATRAIWQWIIVVYGFKQVKTNQSNVTFKITRFINF